ncbi:hypothetical protein O5D80_006322 [Batrachochytrium dendrobatidis]|nr:hypothetical protein O5D80_006322 [Batrachochytrium dendrobatidis]
MKFSIALLSSILAVCSVTVANPVDPSLTTTTSTEASTSTTSPSATSTDGPDYPGFSSPYDQYLNDCFPIDSEGIFLIKQYADGKNRYDKEKKKVDEKQSKIEEHEQLWQELNTEFIDRREKVFQGIGVDNFISDQYDYQCRLFEQWANIDRLKKEMEELHKKYTKVHEKWTKLQSELYDYLLEHDKTAVMTTDGTPDLNLYPGFMKCFSIFYNGSPQ